MLRRVRRIFERDLDKLLDEIDRNHGELIRIIPIPRVAVKSRDCTECIASRRVSSDPCPAHLLEWQRIIQLNPNLTAASLEVRSHHMRETEILLKRYAVVYREFNEPSA